MTKTNETLEAGMLIRTKLNMPRVVTELVKRPRLIDRLNQGLQRKVTLISAPAGYGKSTLAVTWLQQLPCPTAWVSLDEQDNELANFLAYLIAAIHTIYPEACAKTASYLKAAQLPSADFLAVSLVNELAALPQTSDDDATHTRQGFVLAFDDYHRIEEPTIHNFMGQLIAYQPSGMHLLLISRKDPTQLPLIQLRAWQKLLEIRLKDLRFDLSETQTFLQQIPGLTLPDEAAIILSTKTEGWILGLRLASLSLRDKANPMTHVQALHGTNQYVMEYLLDEILAHQPEAIRDFLLKTAILDRFCGPLCEIVAGVDDPTCDGQAYLEWLEQVNLFVINLDSRRQWYRYHHLFRDLLLHKLKAEYSAEDIADLHRRASHWLADNGDLDTAITHAITVDDIEMVADIIEAHRHELVERENWPMLHRLLKRLPVESIAPYPTLLVLKGWERRVVGDYSPEDQLLDQVEALLMEQPDVMDAATAKELLGEVDCLRAHTAWYLGDFERALILAQHAHDRLSPDRFPYTFTRQTIAHVLQSMGRLDQVRQHLRYVLESGSDQLNAYPRTNWFALFTSNYLAGEWIEANRVVQQFVTLFGDQPLSPELSAAYYFLGVIHYEWNHLKKARYYFDLITSRYVYPLVYQDSFICLALCHQALDQPEQARQTLDALKDFVGTTGRTHLFLPIEAMTAQLVLLADDPEAAIRWANSVALGPPAAIRIHYKEPHISQAKALIAQGTAVSLAQAQQNLQAIVTAAEKSHNLQRTVEALAGLSLAYAAHGDQAQALNSLERALTLAQPQGFIRTFVDYGSALGELLLKLQPGNKAQRLYLQQLFAAFGQRTSQTPRSVAQPLPEPLTDRELEILAMLARRQAYKEIAASLVISPQTVKTHARNIYKKLGVNRRDQAVAKAEALHILPYPNESA